MSLLVWRQGISLVSWRYEWRKQLTSDVLKTTVPRGRNVCLSLSLSLPRSLERWPWGPRIFKLAGQRREGRKEGGGRGWRERDTEPGGKQRTMSAASKALRWCACSWMDICEVHPTDFSFWCHMAVRCRHNSPWHCYCLPVSRKALFLGPSWCSSG